MAEHSASASSKNAVVKNKNVTLAVAAAIAMAGKTRFFPTRNLWDSLSQSLSAIEIVVAHVIFIWVIIQFVIFYQEKFHQTLVIIWFMFFYRWIVHHFQVVIWVWFVHLITLHKHPIWWSAWSTTGARAHRYDMTCEAKIRSRELDTMTGRRNKLELTNFYDHHDRTSTYM